MAEPIGKKRSGMPRLIRELIRPYRGTLLVIFIAMMVETLMSLAGPWPLKIILDNVVGSHHLPKWFDDSLGSMTAGLGPGKMKIAAVAALAAVLIAIIGSIASYIDNYYTESVGQINRPRRSLCRVASHSS
jgi:ABC-type multidrug transport system fused ATPase/permease subunit